MITEGLRESNSQISKSPWSFPVLVIALSRASFFSFVSTISDFLPFYLSTAAVKISPGKLNGFASRMEAPNKVLPAYWKLDFRTSPRCEDQTEPIGGGSPREGNATSRIASGIKGIYQAARTRKKKNKLERDVDNFSITRDIIECARYFRTKVRDCQLARIYGDKAPICRWISRTDYFCSCLLF